MARDPKKYLYDMRAAVDFIMQFTRGVSFDAFQNDPLWRSAVARQLGIVGEALAQLAKIGASMATQTQNYRTIIAFRNILIHGDASVDHRLV